MGIVTDYLIHLLHRQVDEHGVVVWFDPEKLYADLVSNLELRDAHIEHFAVSYLELRRSVDAWMNDVQSDKPPRLVLYIPLDRSETRHILDEFIFAGAVLQPGERQPRNTNLGVIARNALKTRFTKERLEEVVADIHKGRITSLEELDRLAEQGDTGALALIFGTGQPSEIAQKFLFDDAFDKQIVKRQAVEQLGSVLSDLFGINLESYVTPDQLRQRVRKQLLINEFCIHLSKNLPASLASISLPESSLQRRNGLEFVENWRNRRDLQDAYIQTADETEKDLQIDYEEFNLDDLKQVYTFTGSERQLQVLIEKAIRDEPRQDFAEIARQRRPGFWAEVDETISTRWTLDQIAAELLILAGHIQWVLRNVPLKGASGFVRQYTNTAQPWSKLDTLHRMMEKFALTVDYSPGGDHSSLERLLARARQVYARTVDELSREFLNALAQSNYNVTEFISQNEVFSRFVAPVLDKKKVAYVLVDALRYEMAVDLAASMDHDWQIDISPAIAVPPTITLVGMAALLPGAERGVSLVQVGDLAAQVGDQILKTRKDRISYLAKRIPDLVEVKLDALIPAKRSIRDALTAAKFILVTSQEIDLLGEGDNAAQGREFMDSVLIKLARAFRVLSDHGVERIIVSSDHGYLFVDELDADQTIPAPGGQTADLHRRVWVGKGGQAHDGVLRTTTEAFNLGGDLEIATPLGLACFAVPGGRAFFHGGLSLQELVIPVLILEPEEIVQPSQVEWTLLPGRDRITTRFFSVQIAGRAASRSMFESEPHLLRVEMHAGGKVISSPVTATYGLQEATGELKMQWSGENSYELEPNTVALRLTGEVHQKSVSVLLIDAETDKTLKKIEVKAAISI